MVILAASITTAEAVQFHKIEFYKQTFSKLSSEDQNSGGLHFFIEHVKDNKLKDHSNKTCEHWCDVDLGLVKNKFRRQLNLAKTYHARYDGALKRLHNLKLVVYRNCYQTRAKGVDPNPTNDPNLVPRLK